MILLTLDTNVLIDGLETTCTEPKQQVYKRLLALHEAKLVEIGMTTRFEQDKVNDRVPARVKRQREERARFPTVQGPMRLGASRLGFDVFVDGELMNGLEQIFGTKTYTSVSRHNTLWDIDHLYGHRAAGREYFLTYDNGILRRANRLERLGIRVWNPESFLNAVRVAENQVETADELDALLPAALGKAFKEES